MKHTTFLSADQEKRFVEGLERVAKPILRNANYHEILGDRLGQFFTRHGFEEDKAMFSPADALSLLDRSMFNKRIAVQMLPPRVAAAWGKTRNNLREFDFFKRILRNNGLDDQIFNVSHHRKALDLRMHTVPLTVPLRELFKGYVYTQWPISRACIFQLVNYVHAYLCWLYTFQNTPALPRVVVLANDHSPNQVACTVVAQDLNVPVIYIQHAEVTTAFPPLAFDLSILRNEASLEVYKSIGPVDGATHVISRDETPFIPERFNEACTGEIVVGVYLTAQVKWQGVRQVLASLNANNSVRSVFVKPHPSQSQDQLREELPEVTCRTDFIQTPHIAVVANSSVVIELIHSGNVVLQNYDMDDVPRDYYGFSSQGIAPEISIDDLSTEFWRKFEANEDWRRAYQMYDPWAAENYQGNEQQLADDLKQYFPPENSQRAGRCSEDYAAEAIAGSPELLARALLRSAPNAVVEYLNEPGRVTANEWSQIASDLEFTGALEQIFNGREANSYELFATTRRVKQIASHLVYVGKRRDIELTGRPTNAHELDEMNAFILKTDLDPAHRWQYQIQFLLLLLRLDEEQRIVDLFAALTPMPIRKLGINPRVALVRWIREKPQVQLSLKLVPAQFYEGLAAFQRMKLMVLSATPDLFEKHPWSHEDIEQQFFELASSGVKKEFAEIFVSCYEKIRPRMQFMEVRWSLAQREAFYSFIKHALSIGKAFSLVRLSDREAYMYADEGEFFTTADVENCERHWWRLQLSHAKRAVMTQQMRRASQNADILGVPCVYRLMRQTDVKTKSLMTTLQGRGLAEVARVVAEHTNPSQMYAEEKCNVPLFDAFPDVLRLCNAASRTVLVASANEREVRRLFQSLPEVEYIAIPTHSRTMSNHKYASSENALPEVYDDIREQIASTVRPRDLVLVAAGVIGKIFVDDAKQAGGVALDVGTCLDSWVGAGIHSLH